MRSGAFECKSFVGSKGKWLNNETRTYGKSIHSDITRNPYGARPASLQWNRSATKAPRSSITAVAGDGFPYNATAAGYTAIGYDIVDRRHEPQSLNGFEFTVADFRGELPIGSASSAVFNPPYTGDCIRQAVERALSVVNYKVAALVPLRRLPAAHWLDGLPLETIWLLTPRPSLPPASYIRAGNEPGGGGQDFAWLILNKQRATGSPPRLRWLHRDDGEGTCLAS